MKLKVLVVEDEDLMRREIVSTTPWEEFSCEMAGEAANGIEGEEMIRKLEPDLVITDIRMPGQDGIAMLRNTAPPAAVILTGFSDFSYAREAIRLGVCDYIVKPVDTEEFHKALKKISETLLEQKKRESLPASPFREYMAPLKTDKQDFYIDCAIHYIRKHYDSDISLRDAAGSIGISESYLSRLFKQKVSLTFLEYLRNYRLKKALELMKDQSLRINEIARRTGFRDMSYFSEVFRKHVGVTPSRYLNGLKEPESKAPSSGTEDPGTDRP
jgi:two-component system response regulator YesN